MSRQVEEKNNKEKIYGIPSFLLLLLATILLSVGGYFVVQFAVRKLLSEEFITDTLSKSMSIINGSMLVILMIFFYLSLRCLSDLKKAAEAAERGEMAQAKESDGDIAELINVIGRVTLRMSDNGEKKEDTSTAYYAFVPNDILEYCNVDIHKKVTPGVIGKITGTRLILVLGDYKTKVNDELMKKLVQKIMDNGGLMLSSTSEAIGAIFPGPVTKNFDFIDEELKDVLVYNSLYGHFEIVLAGSESCMFVRARECPLLDNIGEALLCSGLDPEIIK